MACEFRNRGKMNIFTCLVKIRTWIVGTMLLLLIHSCASDPFVLPEHLAPVDLESRAEPGQAIQTVEPTLTPPRKLPALDISSWSDDAGSKWQKLGLGDQATDLNVESMPLNEFIQVALGDVLALSFSVDPAVQAMDALVTLRISKPVAARMLLDTVEQVLAGYQVGLSMEGGTLAVLPASKLTGIAPTFVGARARFSMQQGKIMMIIPLKYSSPDEAMRFVRHFVKLGANASIDSVRRLNALVVIGDAAELQRFRSVVELIDQPSMSGRSVQIFRPIYWQASEIIQLLKDTLKTQGVLIAETAEAPGIYLSEVKQLNSLLVAAPDDALIAWVDDWISALDTPDVAGDTLRSFVYAVKHSTADELGSVVSAVLGGFNAAASDRPTEGDNDAKSGSPSASAVLGTGGSELRMVTDEPHNALVFVGSAQSYKAVYQLLEQIDVPAKQVLLEVTVADVTLESNTQLGVEWQFKGSSGGMDAVGSTLGGLGSGGAGFTYTAFDDAGAIRAQINALATSGDARILSSPRLLAVDNEEAKIQVGTQIAVISSENTSDSVDGIIRSFTYVDTGVILSFTPTVMAGGQVRLQVNQEVSVPGPSLNNTPPINTRSVQTTLIAQSGRTIMIGGLISTTDSVSNQKVPVLGDIPLLGALFRGREVVENTTEMVILITPHIIESSLQLETLTEAFRKKGGW